MNARVILLLMLSLHSSFCSAQTESLQQSSTQLVADEFGRPGPLLQAFLGEEDDLQDVAIPNLDIIYGRKDGMALTLDLYRPSKNPSHKCIVYVMSGGYWSGIEYRRMPYCTAHIREFIDEGFVVAVVMHSSGPRYTIPDMKTDIQRSIHFLHHNSEDYEISADSIGIFGHSSGGHLALLAALTGTTGSPSEDFIDGESSKVQAAVAFFPPTDLLNYGEPGRLMTAQLKELGIANEGVFDFKLFEESRGIFLPQNSLEIMKQCSPITHVDEDAPPILLIHGDKDENVPLTQSQSFVEKMNSVGADATLVIAKDKAHEPIDDSEKHVVSFFKAKLEN